MPMTRNEQMQRFLELTRAAFDACDSFVRPHISLIDNYGINDGQAVEITDSETDNVLTIYPRTELIDALNQLVFDRPIWVIDDDMERLAENPDQRSIVLEAVALYFTAKITPALDAWVLAHERERDTADALDFIRDLNALDSEVA